MQNAKPAIMLFLVALASGLLLGSVNAFTLPKALEQERIALNNNLREIFPEATDFSESEPLNDTVLNVYKAENGAETLGYVIQASSNGYGGAVGVLTGIGDDGSIVKVKISSHGETPGLGANADSDSFTDQYIAKSGHIGVSKQAPGPNDIQAITSATITSNAVTTSVNASLEYFQNNLAGGGK